MAKDPAFLFYPADFMIGTALMSFEQKGKYVSLLCYQHQLGHLSKEDMISVCGEDKRIFSKFKQDPEGLYYNERLEKESIKRSSFSQSRRNNASTSLALAKHMPEHMENVNRNENNKEQLKTTKVQFLEFVFMTQGQYDQLAQKLGKTVLDEYVERLNNYIGSKGKRYKSHYHTILSWTNKDSPKKSENVKRKEPDPNCSSCHGDKRGVFAQGVSKYFPCHCTVIK